MLTGAAINDSEAAVRRRLLKSKIHRATVTDANVSYEGSVTIDRTLMEAADILPWEEVSIWNITNGERLTTYAMPGKAGSGMICINGAAAHKARKGDLVIIATYAEVEEGQIPANFEPKKIFVNSKNEMVGK